MCRETGEAEPAGKRAPCGAGRESGERSPGPAARWHARPAPTLHRGVPSLNSGSVPDVHAVQGAELILKYDGYSPAERALSLDGDSGTSKMGSGLSSIVDE